MNYLEQFKYSKDDPIEFGVDLNTNIEMMVNTKCSIVSLLTLMLFLYD